MAAIPQAPLYPTPTVPSTQLKGSLPDATINENVDANAVATRCISALENLQQDDLTSDALWKDTLSITGHQRTLNSSQSILAAWNELIPACEPHGFKLIPQTAQVFKFGPKPMWISASFGFETGGLHPATCSGLLNIVPNEKGEYKIWVLGTFLEALKIDNGSGNPDTMPDTSFTPAANLKDGDEVGCIVVGGGMAGICLGARLHSLNVPYVVVERNDHVGENWTKRYDSAKLHVIKHYAEMPYERVYEGKPLFLTSRDLADGMQKFVDMHNIQIWLSSSVETAQWDENARRWTIEIFRDGERRTLKAKHLVMAIGGGIDKPFIPEYADRSKYQGTVTHSGEWKNAEPFKGKTGIIIGSANSAFDVAEDMAESKLTDITMIQRGVTHIMPEAHVTEVMGQLYNEHMDVGLADRISMTAPYAIGRLMMMANKSMLQATQPVDYGYLDAAGFRYHQDPDIFSEVMEKFGGHVLDMGFLTLIRDGLVKVKSGNLPTAYTEHGLRLADGTEIEADVIVFCTGFRYKLRQSVEGMVGAKVTDQLDDFWGIDAEGEIRGLAKPIGHHGIWYLGGATAQARFTSRVLALQILADIKGVPFEPFVKTV